MNFILKCDQEVDGRWIAEVPELSGVLSYGDSAASRHQVRLEPVGVEIS
jgi:hypothetical protein